MRRSVSAAAAYDVGALLAQVRATQWADRAMRAPVMFTVGDDGSKHRNNIDRKNEEMLPGFGLLRSHGGQFAGSVAQILGHENGQNGPHAIKTESLSSFAADDVRDGRRHARSLNR